MENIKNTKELLLIADAVSKEKNLEKEIVLEALAEGLATALRKNYPEGSIIKVLINKEGDIKAYRLFELVDTIENVERQMLFNEVDEEVVVDGFVWEDLHFDFNKLNRQQFNITRQVALSKIKNKSRETYITDLLNKDNLLQSGIVKFVKKDKIIVDCNGLDISIPRKKLLPKDNYKNGDKIFFVIEKENNHYYGTRVSNQFIQEILKNKIYPIKNGEVKIISIARNPGFKSKVVLKSIKNNINPVKLCLGHRGSYIQNVNKFLNGETVDLINYDDNIAQLLVNAMSPVEVVKILVDEESHSLDFAVSNDNISQAIGKDSKNIEMVSQLLGWKLHVYSEEEWDNHKNKEQDKVLALFKYALNCDNEISQMLYEEGFSTLEEIAYVPISELREVDLDEETLMTLRNNALDTLNNQLKLKLALGYSELVSLGLNDEQIKKLNQENVLNLNDFKDLSSYDLIDILPELDFEQAKSMIVQSRQVGELHGENNLSSI
jgi:N utilization substance protein A